MLDPMDFKELDRIASAMQQWFASQGIEDRKEHITVMARLMARYIFDRAKESVTVPKVNGVDDLENLTLKEALAAAMAIQYFDAQTESMGKLIKTDLAEMSGWKLKKAQP